jgi:5-methylcytosine-specific restriction endonuclease McrA
MSDDFFNDEPSLENYWRAAILLGKNTASYKFALGASLIELAPKASNSFIPLHTIARPFALRTAQHLREFPKQTSNEQQGKFIAACKEYNEGNLSVDELIDRTAHEGFKYVLDRFHVVDREPMKKKFYATSTRGSERGIILTDEMYQLTEQKQFENLIGEIESRWRIVEVSWKTGISRIHLTHAHETNDIIAISGGRRKNLTSVRDTLNGYQKGRCFYCREHISICSGSTNLGQVDHYFPWSLQGSNRAWRDEIWNLVLACSTCNASGDGGKGNRLPDRGCFLKKLELRNEWLVRSDRSLAPVIKRQLGETSSQRSQRIGEYDSEASKILVTSRWKPRR